MEKSAQLSEKVSTTTRTYFFDVKHTQKGKPFLVVTETRKKKEGEGFERNTITVFEEDFTRFTETITRMLAGIAEDPARGS